MMDPERLEDLLTGHLFGGLDDREQEELEELLATDAEAARRFAALCVEEMELFAAVQAATPEAVPRAPVHSWPKRAAALILAFGTGFLVAEVRSPRSEVPGDARAELSLAELPAEELPTNVILLPLSYDEQGRLIERPIRNAQPLEIANL